jgi:predicted  nucleic acid-binding Zn-ribbon protein
MITKLLPGYCNNCGSGWIETDKDYIWHCRKCGRYEARPVKEREIAPEETGRQIEVEMENRMCANPQCNNVFQARPEAAKDLCNSCMGKHNAKKKRDRIKREQRVIRNTKAD